MPVPLFDQHLHSRHSFDCKTEPRANVEAAIAKGLAGLTFTEHFDTNPRDWPGCIYDDEAYTQTIRGLRAEFKDALFIGKGVEVCFQPSTMDFCLKFLSRHPFDLVILSVHYFHGTPVHKRENWEGYSVAEGARLYLDHVLEAASFCAKLRRTRGRVFDVLGHLDVVKRYSHRFLGSYDVAPFAKTIESILDACLEAEMIPEVNTSSLRQGLDETMPNLEALKTYRRLGGRGVSLGSDAHRAEDIGAGFETATAMLREAGIRETAIFQERQRTWLPLES